MGAPGETNLDAMLATITVVRRPGVFTFIEIPERPTAELIERAQAIVVEDEGTTVVLTTADARAASLSYEVEMAWLSLTVHSSLEGVGLTAALSGALGDAEISCNILAGYRHDHLLVPTVDADRAIGVLQGLREVGDGRTT